MRSHSLMCSRHLRLTATCLLLTIWGGATYADDWDLQYEQQQDVVITLQPVTDAPLDQTCPAHFDLVRLSTQIDLAQVGTITIEPNLPVVRRAIGFVASDRSYVDQSAVLDLQIDILGCAFRRHFLPRTGQFIMSGDFDIGRIENTEFSYVSNDNLFRPQVLYQTRLNGPANGFAYNRGVNLLGLSQEQVMGTLTLDLGFVHAPLISDDRPNQIADFNRLHLKIIVRSE